MQLFSEEHETFRRTFKKFVEKEIAPHIEEWEKEGYPRSVWKMVGDQGYLCPWVEEKYGGSDSGFLFSRIVYQELTRAGSNIGVGIHSDIIVPYISKYCNEEQKERWLPGCTTGDIITALGMTEPDTGSDLQAIKTTAVKDGDYYIINGQKTFITNGVCCDLVVLAAKTDLHAKPPYKGISLFGVEANTPGFTKRKLDKMGLGGQETAELFFEDCRVPVANLIGQEGMGFAYMMDKLQQERLVCADLALCMAERMLEDTIEYAKTRHAFGQPIGKFQHNAFKIAEMATEIELARTFMDHLVADHIEGKDIVTKVSMAKWWIGEMANRIAYHCVQLHGGYGYMEEYRICRLYRDIRGYPILAGTTEIMKLIIARKLGL